MFYITWSESLKTGNNNHCVYLLRMIRSSYKSPLILSLMCAKLPLPHPGYLNPQGFSLNLLSHQHRISLVLRPIIMALNIYLPNFLHLICSTQMFPSISQVVCKFEFLLSCVPQTSPLFAPISRHHALPGEQHCYQDAHVGTTSDLSPHSPDIQCCYQFLLSQTISTSHTFLRFY